MKYAEENSKEGAVRQYEVDCKQICEWCKQKETFEEMKKRGKCSCKRLAGAGRTKKWKKISLIGLLQCVDKSSSFIKDDTTQGQGVIQL